MAKTSSDSEEQLPQGESPFASEPGVSGPQNSRSGRPQVSFTLPPLWAVLAVIGLVVLTVIAVLVIQNVTEDTPATPDPTLVALQAQATQLAMLMEIQNAATQAPMPTIIAQVPTPTALTQVLVVTATTEPRTEVVTNTPLPIQQPVIVTATSVPQPLAATATTAPQAAPNCGTRNGDDINVGRNSGGPCNSMPLSDLLDIMNTALGPMPKPYYDRLDSAFNNSGGAIGYQFRESIPAFIPASSAPAMRVMWGDLGWLARLSDSARQQAERHILRLRCENQYGVCIYLLMHTDGFEINAQGRGVLLSEPLDPETDLPWWGGE